MPQVDWPVRKIRCVTSTRNPDTPYFYCKEDDMPSLTLGAVVKHNGATRYIQPGRNPGERQMSSDEAGRTLINPVPIDFILEKDVAIVTNYPRRPMLVNPTAQFQSSVTNSLRGSAYEIGEPRFEGSIELECQRHGDDNIVEAFIDSLADPAAWFELPLPGNHLGDSDVVGYNTNTGDIRLNALLSNNNLTGWFGRVGRRTCRVVYHEQNYVVNSDPSLTRDWHTIRIVPASLITGTTNQDDVNQFASGGTCRVRATSVISTGESDDDALHWVRFLIQWVETRGEEIVP